MDPAELLLGLLDELLDRLPVADVAAPGVDLDAHGGERGLGQERLLAHVPARHVHEAERNVAAQPAELHRDVPAEAGGAAGDDGHLAAPPLADRLGPRLLERSPARLRRLVFPGGPVAEAEGWQWHGIRRYGSRRR